MHGKCGNDGQKYENGAWSLVTYPNASRRGEAGVVAIDGQVALIGGRFFETTVPVYNPANDSWSESVIPPLLWGVTWPAAVVLGSNLYVIAGEHPTLTDNKMAMYDGSTWTQLPDTPFIENRADGVAHDGMAWVMTGNLLYRYDPSNTSWASSTVSLPAGDYHELVAVGTELYILADVNSDIVIYRLNAY